MANLIIKASSGNSLVVQGADDSPAITVATDGATTFAENATLSGTGNSIASLGTVTSGTLGSAVVGAQAGTCAFSAYHNADPGWEAPTAGTRLDFKDERYDTDSCYDTSNDRFVAPATGIYYFWYAIYTAGSDAANGFQFTKNGSGDGIALGYQSANYLTFAEEEAGDHVQQGSLVAQMNADDNMSVIAATDSSTYISHSSWGGCRLR